MGRRAVYRREQKQEQKESKKVHLPPVNPPGGAQLYSYSLMEELKLKEAMEREEKQLKEKLTREVDRQLGDKYYQQIYPEAYSDGFKAGYQESLDRFDVESQSIFYISFGLALKEKFPRWGADAIETIVQDAIDWNERYIQEFHKDLDAYRLHYGVVVGRKFELEEIQEAVEHGKAVD